ncbi:hypothetical protein HG531_007246 [Fusarium graminearum]|nr:hypothetical protein HG531_007246 [Fusarium graminearum]
MLCLSTGVGDVVGSDATRLLSNVPMLNANWLAFTSRSVVGECSNIANSVNILKASNRVVVIDLDGSVLLKCNAAVVLEILSRGGNTHPENDQVRLQPQLDALALERLLESCADLFTKNPFKWDILHADDSHIIVAGCSNCTFHSDEGRSNNHDLLALVANLVDNLFRVIDCAESENIVKVLKSFKGQSPGCTTRREDQFRVRDLLSPFGCNKATRKVDVVDVTINELDGAAFVEVLVSPGQLVKVGQKSLAQLRSVDWVVSLVGDDGDASLPTLLAKTLDNTQCT